MTQNFYPVFAFTADNHLKEYLWVSRPHIKNDTLHSFDFICNYCKTHNLPLVLGGDVFDTPRPSTAVLSAAVNSIKKVPTVYWLEGNHDKSNPSWPQVLSQSLDNNNIHDLSENSVFTIKSNKKEAKPVAIYGIPHSNNHIELADRFASLTSLVRETNATTPDIYISHQLISLLTGDMIANVSVSNYADTPPSSIIFMGDYHQAIEAYDQSGRLYAYCGSSALLSTSEPISKSFILFGYQNNKPTIQRIPIPTRRCVRMTLDKLQHVEQLESELQQALSSQPDNLHQDLKNPLAIVRYSSDDSQLTKELSKVLDKFKNQVNFFTSAETSAKKHLEAALSATKEAPIDTVVSNLLASPQNSKLCTTALKLVKCSLAEVDAVLEDHQKSLGI